MIIIGIEYLFEFEYDLISSSYNHILTRTISSKFWAENLNQTKNLNLTILIGSEDIDFENITNSSTKITTQSFNNASDMHNLTTIASKSMTYTSSYVYLYSENATLTYFNIKISFKLCLRKVTLIECSA